MPIKRDRKIGSRNALKKDNAEIIESGINYGGVRIIYIAKLQIMETSAKCTSVIHVAKNTALKEV